MLSKITDWKFAAATIIGVVGLLIGGAVPFILWKMDLQSKSLSLRIFSSVAIQSTAPSIEGIQIFIEGQKIENPFLTTLELLNDGDKPISAADFESPITLIEDQAIKIVRVQTAELKPAGLPVAITSSSSALRIAPLLLNPGDSIKLVVITSGGGPKFQPIARIAGISQISVKKSEGHPIFLRIPLIWTIFGLTFISYVLTAAAFIMRLKRGSVSKNLGAAAAISALASTFTTMLLLMEYSINLEFIPAWLIALTSAVSIYGLWRTSRSMRRKYLAHRLRN